MLQPHLWPDLLSSGPAPGCCDVTRRLHCNPAAGLECSEQFSALGCCNKGLLGQHGQLIQLYKVAWHAFVQGGSCSACSGMNMA